MKETKNKLKIIGLLLTLVISVSLLGVFSLTASANNKIDAETWGEYSENASEYVYTYADFSPFDSSLGFGSQEKPYNISTPEQLAGFAALVNTYGESPVTLTDSKGNTVNATEFHTNHERQQYVKLTADIDLSGRDWIPIGTDSDSAFGGVFNGAGHTISGLLIDSSTINHGGLFGYVTGGTIKNVGVSGVVNVIASESINAGALVGCVSGIATIENCYSSCNVSGTTNAGGLVGKVLSNAVVTITNCYNTGSVSGIGIIASDAGGLVGQVFPYAEVTITNCYNTGSVSGTTNAGGLVGLVSSYAEVTITNCYSACDVSGESAGGCVGLVGSDVTTITNCYWYADRSLGAVGRGITTGSHQQLSQDQMKAEAGETDSSWDTIGILDKAGSLVDALNRYVTDEADATTVALTPWHIHDGEYPTSGAKNETATPNTDGQTHTVSCTGCNFSKNEPHIGGIATCTTQAVCTVCGASYGEVDTTNHDNSVFFNEKGFCENGCYEPATSNAEGCYEIGNAGQLYWFAGLVNGTLTNGTAQNTSANAVLTANITVNENVLTEDGTLGGDGSNFKVWTPIGYWKSGSDYVYYTGTFDGKEYAVSGLYFNDSSAVNVSLFGLVGESGSVQNLGMVDFYFCGEEIVGGVAGENRGTVTNCHTVGTVTGSWNVGGLVGSNFHGSMQNCYNTGSVSGSTCVGGLVGYNRGFVQSCYNTGTVNGEINVGGLVGYCSIGCRVTDSYNTGNVSGNEYVGGIAGDNYESTINNCYNVGNVSGNEYVGGVVGNYMDGVRFDNCYYLDSTASGGINGEDEAGQAEGKTAAQFESGEVAYLLGSAWGQILTGENRQSYPVPGGTTVYQNRIKECYEESFIYEYANTEQTPIIRHAWNEGAVTTDPTCSAVGVKTFTCTHNSAHTKTEDVAIDANAHAWNEGVVTTDPTCSEVGVKTFTCTHNSEHIKTEEVNALGHAYDDVCDTTCNICGEERIPADHVDEDENNTCDICGSEISKDGLSGGAVAGIVVGSTAAVGLGGFSLFWFVIKKKKWSDLIGIFKK